MNEFTDLAETVRRQLNLNYDTISVKFIEEFIERQRHHFNADERKGLVNSLAAFVGECIIKNYGGHWALDDDSGEVCVAFDEKNKVFPFAKTNKQFDNGLEDSVYSFYTIIPTIFNITLLTSTADSNNTPSAVQSAGTKSWWKFW